jgi:hypothetical protein
VFSGNAEQVAETGLGDQVRDRGIALQLSPEHFDAELIHELEILDDTGEQYLLRGLRLLAEPRFIGHKGKRPRQ